MTDHDLTVDLSGATFKVSYSLTPMCRETGTSDVIESSLRVECVEIEDADLVAGAREQDGRGAAGDGSPHDADR